MSGAVVRRVVPRWFYRGKGYATETAALKAKAKDLLRDELYGDRSCFTRPFDHERDTWVFEEDPPKTVPLNDSESKAVAIALLAAKFPHGNACDEGPHWEACYMDDYGDFLRPWCRKKHKAWIDAKVAELRRRPPE